jgi:hypothetical protein
MSIIIAADNYCQLQNKANEDMNKINAGLKLNHLTVNTEKSSLILMGQPKKDCNIDVKLNDIYLKRITNSKILGIEFDANLHFEKHVDNLFNKLSKYVSFLSRLRHEIPETTLSLVFNALI